MQGSLFNPETESQTGAILAHLLSGKAINPLQALNDYKCFRLGARIWDIRKAGYNVERQMIRVASGKRVAPYRLVN